MSRFGRVFDPPHFEVSSHGLYYCSYGSSSIRPFQRAQNGLLGPHTAYIPALDHRLLGSFKNGTGYPSKHVLGLSFIYTVLYLLTGTEGHPSLGQCLVGMLECQRDPPLMASTDGKELDCMAATRENILG